MSEVVNTSPPVRAEKACRTYGRDSQEVRALKGHSGSGKTTLLNLIGGLDQPTSGSIYFDSQSLGEITETQLPLLRRYRIGFIFQSFALLPTYSAFENVELALRFAGLKRADQVRVRQTLPAGGRFGTVDAPPPL